MKRILLLLLLLAAAVFIFFKYVLPDKPSAADEKADPYSIQSNDTGFRLDFNNQFIAYLKMKDAFIKSDIVLINRAARQYDSSISLLDFGAIEAAEPIKMQADMLAGTISRELEALQLEPNLEDKRRSFQMISDALFDLMRTIRYTGSKIYKQYCPMAFNNNGAYWLSNSNNVINPYFGESMLHCGEVIDSLNLR